MTITGPETVVAIAFAAHKVGNTSLKRKMVYALLEEFGIKISFTNDTEKTAYRDLAIAARRLQEVRGLTP